MKTIRQLRQDQDWTQFALALRVGVQPQAIYYWESGRRMPQVAQMRRLGQLFDICSDEIDLEPPRADAARPNLAALSEAEVHELLAIEAALRPTRDDPFGAAALTVQQIARVRALAAKAWDPPEARRETDDGHSPLDRALKVLISDKS
jgi:transcriptional regulator with XRE-family HTH domain